MSNQIYIGIGSNLNKEKAILFCIAQLKSLLEHMQFSSVWHSHAVRAVEPDYYNLVVKAETNLSLEELYKSLSDIEEAAGVEFMYHNGTNFGMKRRLDIDILMFNDQVTNTPCKLPRHDIVDYPFVICPLLELNEDIVHPQTKEKIALVWEKMQDSLQEHQKVYKVDFDFNQPAPQWNEN